MMRETSLKLIKKASSLGRLTKKISDPLGKEIRDYQGDALKKCVMDQVFVVMKMGNYSLGLLRNKLIKNGFMSIVTK